MLSKYANALFITATNTRKHVHITGCRLQRWKQLFDVLLSLLITHSDFFFSRRVQQDVYKLCRWIRTVLRLHHGALGPLLSGYARSAWVAHVTNLFAGLSLCRRAKRPRSCEKRAHRFVASCCIVSDKDTRLHCALGRGLVSSGSAEARTSCSNIQENKTDEQFFSQYID